MEKKITQDLEVLRKHKIAKLVYAHLSKREMSVKELAEKIYNNKLNRHEITKWIKYFKLWGWIEEVKSLSLLREKKYKATLKPFIEKYDEDESVFIEIFLERFWNPFRRNPWSAFNEILLEAFLVKKTYKIKKILAGYKPEEDLDRYETIKEDFWEDNEIRNKFLDNIKKKGEKKFEKPSKSKNKPVVLVSHDFLFMCLMIPETIFEKLEGGHNTVGDPLFLAVTLLDY